MKPWSTLGMALLVVGWRSAFACAVCERLGGASQSRMGHAVRRQEPRQLEPDRHRQLEAGPWRARRRQRQRLHGVEDRLCRLRSARRILDRGQDQQRRVHPLHRSEQRDRENRLRGQYLGYASRAEIRHGRDRRRRGGRSDAARRRQVEHLRDHRQGRHVHGDPRRSRRPSTMPIPTNSPRGASRSSTARA